MIDLPEPPRPVGAYAPVMVRGGIGFVSGQFPLRDGKLAYTGQVGLDLSVSAACDACEIAALNVLAQISDATDGFMMLDGLLRLEGYIASAQGFVDQPKILNVASDIFRTALGDRGRHARTAFSVEQLPMNAPIELCVSFAVKR